MDLMGLCNICGKPNAMYTCRMCGKNVCITCYDSTHGICCNCKRGKQ